jgi:hypothetical protein
MYVYIIDQYITAKVQEHTTRDARQDVTNNYLNNFIKLIKFIDHSCMASIHVFIIQIFFFFATSIRSIEPLNLIRRLILISSGFCFFPIVVADDRTVVLPIKFSVITIKSTNDLYFTEYLWKAFFCLRH